MPYIETEVDIDPSDFLDSCSGRELKEAVDWIVDEMETNSDLREHFHGVSKRTANVEFLDIPTSTIGEAEFADKLNSLREAYYRMEVADQETIEKLFTKYVWH